MNRSWEGRLKIIEQQSIETFTKGKLIIDALKGWRNAILAWTNIVELEYAIKGNDLKQEVRTTCKSVMRVHTMSKISKDKGSKLKPIYILVSCCSFFSSDFLPFRHSLLKFWPLVYMYRSAHSFNFLSSPLSISTHNKLAKCCILQMICCCLLRKLWMWESSRTERGHSSRISASLGISVMTFFSSGWVKVARVRASMVKMLLEYNT